MLENIRIVMVNTSHPGNIGAAARAMKNMSLQQLYLVDPLEFPSAEAASRATHAVDIINNAVVCPSLSSAIADCSLVIGTSARERNLNWVIEKPHQMALTALAQCQAVDAPVAIVFGRERTGLTNQELALCHRLVHIPTNPDCSSLNVAAAVQVIAYELFNTVQEYQTESFSTKPDGDDQAALAGQIQTLHQHLQQVMSEVEFFGSNNPENVMRRLQIFLNRAQPSRRELNILHGILTAMQRKL
ncbi:MAG: RNA methyltransferase [Gammaproteobacteria bacterium]|nr:RNA methyltransferase [Gammaproteobacteria bacterium]